MKIKPKFLILAVLGGFAAMILINDHFFASADTSLKGKVVVRENGVTKYYEQGENASPAAASPVGGVIDSSDAGGKEVLPPRVLNAPSYEKVIMAARIINEAVSQDSARVFIALKENHRNAKLQTEIAKLQAEAKGWEAEAATAMIKIKASKEGRILTPEPGEVSQALTNQVVNGLRDGTAGAGDSKEKDISLRNVDKGTGLMIIKIGDRWFSSVASGQTVGGYLVGAQDKQLQCVSLSKEGEENKVICLN